MSSPADAASVVSDSLQTIPRSRATNWADMKTAIDHDPDEADDLDALIDRARGRDRDAFETLYRMHHRQVHALSLRLTRDGEVAEELTQEVFVQAWRAIPRFRGDSRLGTWLHTITVRTHLEMRRRADWVATHEVPEDGADTYAFAARRAMPGTEIDLERAIGRLPEGARQVLVLHDIHGYKHREIGQMLGVSDGTSKTQLHRARKLMRSYLSLGDRGRPGTPQVRKVSTAHRARTTPTSPPSTATTRLSTMS